jgi:dTMP kinase
LAGSDISPERKEVRGLFITFEGGDGAGKSTQIQRLAKHLRTLGLKVTVSREPGGTPGAEAVRHVVLDTSAAEPFGPYLEAMLFAAARNDHVEQKIRPALNDGHVVLVDRFMDSTRVYQGAGSDLDPDFVGALERVAIAGLTPDLTIILDLPPEEGLKRAHARRHPSAPVDRYEKEDIATHRVRRAAFLEIAKNEPERCQVVDATGAAGDVAERVWNVVSEALKKSGLTFADARQANPSARDRLLGFRK